MSVGRPSVVMLGPSLESHGGMASCASTLLNGGLDRRCNVRYLATTEEGCKARKLACGLSTLFVFSREAKDCDLVHIHFSYGVSMTRKALFVRRAKNMGKKVILHSHSSAMERAILEGDSGSKNEIKKFLSLADALIVLSSKWKDLICDELDIKRSIVHVIPNGVPLGDPSAKPDHDERSCCNILFLGRLEEEKGVGTLIEATGALVRNGAVIELVLAGSGSDEETQRYQLLARREGVNCSFVGWVDSEKKRDLLVEADVFALPSKREVLPISLREAMGAGVASVASDCGSVPEVIHHGRNGMLCEPGDPESLRTCLALLVQDPVLRKRLAIQGFETVKKGYSVENSVDALLGLYKEVLHG